MVLLYEKGAIIMDWNGIADIIVKNGLKILISLVALFICFKVINAISKRLQKQFSKTDKLDKSTVRTLIYIGKILLKIVLVICFVGFVGIDTSGITALITSLGVCFGLAINGAVANFAGGILLLLTKPFKVDDYIEACGYEGVVEDIHLTNTKICTYDNKVVYIPNGTLSAEKIVNHFQKEIRRVDIPFDVDYSTDVEKAKAAALRAIKNTPLVLSEPEPMARVLQYKESGICIITRTWVNSKDYWTVFLDITENVKREFVREGITVPFNQLDVHIKNGD
ncbi:MAG: mechanosensitive ion channel family protein [Clostridia bacterium]|nr:mechanosensitive ion channel family protein [Clostridia bacterium]